MPSFHNELTLETNFVFLMPSHLLFFRGSLVCLRCVNKYRKRERERALLTFVLFTCVLWVEGCCHTHTKSQQICLFGARDLHNLVEWIWRCSFLVMVVMAIHNTCEVSPNFLALIASQSPKKSGECFIKNKLRSNFVDSYRLISKFGLHPKIRLPKKTWR